MERFSTKVGVVYLNVCILNWLKEELAWAIDRRLRVISNKVLVNSCTE